MSAPAKARTRTRRTASSSSLSGPELVSVVIPAFNAEATICDTLLSVRNQTYGNLEILVVDDGSSDRTTEIVAGHAEADERVRMLSQTNAGVAAARNLGISEARGELVAPVDADDLWQPTKIERQLRALAGAGPAAAVAYCWSAVIDGSGTVTSLREAPTYAGDVLAQLCYGNLVGNGSAALMRKHCVLEAGGYDPSLRKRSAQGCEDWKLFLRLAESYDFAVVPDYLVGYRYAPTAMSGDVAQMLRSDAIVRSEMMQRRPEYKLQLNWGREVYVHWLLRREFEAGHWDNCLLLLRESNGDKGVVRLSLRLAGMIARIVRRRVRRRRTASYGVPFLPEPRLVGQIDRGTDEGVGTASPQLSRRNDG